MLFIFFQHLKYDFFCSLIYAIEMIRYFINIFYIIKIIIKKGHSVDKKSTLSIENFIKNQDEKINNRIKIMHDLDKGIVRAANKIDGKWVVNFEVKSAILEYMSRSKSQIIFDETSNYFDKIPLKTQNWDAQDFEKANFRIVPGAIVRYSAFIAQKCVIMPSFINVGAYIDFGTMIDSHVTVGSCCQIGRNCHISDGVTLAGVLEPISAAPVIIEDGVFVGARSVVSEGVIVGQNSVIGAGVILTQSTKIIDKENGQITYGVVPENSVVVPGAYGDGKYSTYALIIVKKVDQKTREKVGINELLRE